MAHFFAKGDRVRAYATRFDKAEVDLEEGEHERLMGMGFGVRRWYRVCMSKKGERHRST
jgi:hypothetical protein